MLYINQLKDWCTLSKLLWLSNMVIASSNSTGANTDQAEILYDNTDPDIDEQFN